MHLISDQMRIQHQNKQKTTGINLLYGVVTDQRFLLHFFISAQRLRDRLIRFSNKVVFFYMIIVILSTVPLIISLSDGSLTHGMPVMPTRM